MNEAHLLIPDNFGRGDITPRPEAFMAHRLEGETMGTSWSASWCAPPGLREDIVRAEFESGFAAMIASMSPWEPSSLISQYNRLPPGGHIATDAAFAEVMIMALDIAHATGGAFDPCLGGEVMRLGFGPAGIGAGKEGRAAGAEIWDQLLEDDGSLYQPGGVTLDVSAIAKGYAVDQMAMALEWLGVNQYLVEIGGEFVARGVKPDRSPWWVDLENPCPGEAPWRVALVGQALATSGDYRQQSVRDGQILSHIVPSLARSCTFGDLASVTVIHENCALADAWATAIFAAGDAPGLELASAHGLKVLLQYRNASARMSPALTAWSD